MFNIRVVRHNGVQENYQAAEYRKFIEDSEGQSQSRKEQWCVEFPYGDDMARGFKCAAPDALTGSPSDVVAIYVMSDSGQTIDSANPR